MPDYHALRTFLLTKRGRALIALTLFVLIVLGMNAQLVVHLSTHIIGRPFEDAFEVLWQLSWVRDAVLHQRHQLEEPCLDNDQTNAVLGLFDGLVPI